MEIDTTTLIHHFLEKPASIHPQKIAVTHGQRKISYSQLNHRANQIANFLMRNKIRKGERIGILFKNSIEYITVYFGVLKSGAIVVPLNTENPAETLSHILNDCAVSGIFCQNRYKNLLSKTAATIPSLKWIVSEDQTMQNNFASSLDFFSLQQIFASEFDTFTPLSIIDSDICCILYTSGREIIRKSQLNKEKH